MHVFCTSEFKGDPNESDEMKPQWFNVPSLPYDQMWADDRYYNNTYCIQSLAN